MPEKDPILERILYYAEIDRTTAQLALAVARLGQVIWQLEQRQRLPADPDGPVTPADIVGRGDGARSA